MATLTLIRGLPGSGKSTLAKLLASGLPAHHYEADMFFIQSDGAYAFEVARIGQAHRWCLDCTEELLAGGQNVVVSNTFTRNWEMAPYFAAAWKVGALVQVLETKGDFGNIHDVPDGVLAAMRQRWEEFDSTILGQYPW